eukprot:3205641-Rhodomonas_salina.2
MQHLDGIRPLSTETTDSTCPCANNSNWAENLAVNSFFGPFPPNPALEVSDPPGQNRAGQNEVRGENSSFLAMHRNNAALLLQIFLLPVATLAFAWPPTLNTLPASGNVHSIHQSLFVQRGSLKGVRYCRNNDFSAHQSSQCRSSNTLPLFALGTSSGSFEHTPQNTLRGGVNQQGAFRSSFTSAPLIASPSGR